MKKATPSATPETLTSVCRRRRASIPAREGEQQLHRCAGPATAPPARSRSMLAIGEAGRRIEHHRIAGAQPFPDLDRRGPLARRW